MMNYSMFMRCLVGILALGLGSNPVQASETKIAQIRSTFQHIENGRSLKKQVFKYEADEPNGYTLERYTDPAGSLKKVVLITGGDHGSIRMSFYYEGTLPVFCYTDLRRFDYPETGDAESERDTWVREEERFYFEHDRCLRYLKKSVKNRDRNVANQRLASAANTVQNDGEREQSVHQLGKRLVGIQSADLLKSYVLE